MRRLLLLPALLCALPSCKPRGDADTPLPPPWRPVAPAFEGAPPPSPKLADHPALADVPGLAATWLAEERTVYVGLDKPLYRPGEAVWVKSWSLTQQGLQGAADKRSLSYKLIGPRSETVATKRVEETGGTATNDFVLDSTARGGSWRVQCLEGKTVLGERRFVVANYQAPRFRKELEFLQKAYGPGDEVSAAFSIAASGGGPLADQKVTALVTVDGQELAPVGGVTDSQGELTVSFVLPAELSQGRGLLTLLVDDGGDTESIARSIPIKLSDLRLGFFPEGGDLVAGLPSRVYFEGRDRFDEPADVAGFVVDDQGNDVAQFESLHDGFGRLDFAPVAGRRYQARLTRPAGLESERFPLPTPKAAGCVLRTFDDPTGQQAALRAQVRCTDPRPVVLAGSQRGAFLGFAAVQAGPEGAVVHLDPSDPGLARARGLARLTLLDDQLSPLAERLVFRNWGRGLKVDVTPGRAVYGPRETVELTVTTRDQDGQPVAAEVAVAVVDDAVLDLADDRRGNMLSAALLESHLPGELDKPQYYFDPEEDDAAAMLELVVGARGWRRFAEDSPAFEAAPSEDAPPILEPPVAAPPPRLTRPEPKRRSVFQEARRRLASPGFGDPLGLPDDLDLSDGLSNADGLGGSAGIATSSATAGLRGGAGQTIDLGVGNLEGAGIGRPDPGFFDRDKTRSPEIRIKSGPTTVQGGDSDDANSIKRTLRRYQGRMKRCYERVLQSDPTVRGAVEVRMDVEATGRVGAVKILSNSTGSSKLDACLKGQINRIRFNPPPAQAVTVVDKLVFASEWSGGGRPGAYADPTPRPAKRRVTRSRFDKVRPFPIPSHSPDYAGPRNDFRDTVLWSPTLRTDEAGQATVTFALSDAIATFTVTAEAASQGDLGRGTATLASRLPFSMSVKLPAEVSAGDRLRLPVSLSNSESVASTVGVSCEVGSLLTLGERPADVVVPGEGKARLFIPLDVGDGQVTSKIAVTANAAGLIDGETRQLTVVPRGFPRASYRSGTLTKQASHTVELDPELQSIRATLTLFPDPLSSLEEGMAAMLREPHGCFEQVSSANYPNVLVLRYLQSRGKARPGLVRSARAALHTGYTRLAAYEVPGGGFDWYGRAPAHEELTAYGLLQFADMRRVYRGIDSAMLDRAGAWLRGRSDGRGGFLQAPRRWKFGANDALRAAYIAWGMASAGVAPEPQALARSAALASKSDDPYLLALAASTLLATPGKDSAGRAAAGRLASRQGPDGSWSGEASVTNSGEWARRVEATSLAIITLIRAGQDAAAEKGVAWLHANRQGSRWGSTQSTVLALRALVAHGEAHPPPAGPSVVTVLVNGEPAGTVTIDPQSTRAVTVPGLSGRLVSGSNRVELRNDGPGKVPYSLSVRSRSRQPANHPKAPLTLVTSLSRSKVPLAEPVQLTAVIDNQSGADVANPLVRLGLPAGLSAQPWQLEKLVKEGDVAAFEIAGRDVILYLDGLKRGADQTLGLDLLAEIPGTTTGPASTIYPYYSDDEASWAPELAVEVLGGDEPVEVAPVTAPAGAP